MTEHQAMVGFSLPVSSRPGTMNMSPWQTINTNKFHKEIFSWESLPQENTHTLVEHAIVVQAYNPRTQETEVERLHVQHQPGLQRKNLSQKIQCLVNLMMIEFLKIATFGIRYRWKRDFPPPPHFLLFWSTLQPKTTSRSNGFISSYNSQDTVHHQEKPTEELKAGT